MIGTFFAPARTALVPRVVPVEGLLAANSLGQMTRMVAGVIGAGVTGVIAGVAGTAWPVFVVDAATFLVSAVIVLRVSREVGLPEVASAASIRARGMGGAVLDGLRLIAGSAPLVAALGGVAVTMLGVGAINVLFIPFLVNDLGASPAWAGPLEAAQTVAMVRGRRSHRKPRRARQRPAAVRGRAPGTGACASASCRSSRDRSCSSRSCSGRARSRCRSRRRR